MMEPLGGGPVPTFKIIGADPSLVCLLPQGLKLGHLLRLGLGGLEDPPTLGLARTLDSR